MNEALVKVYDEMYLEYPEDIFEEPHLLVNEALTYEIPGAALDIGAGLGRHSLACASRKRCKVTAIDISKTGMERLERIARQYGWDIEARAADIREEGIHTFYGLIICTFVLHHFQMADATNLIEQMKLHTLAGGINVIAAVTTESEYFEADSAADLDRCYFGTGELKNIYAGWGILSYNEWQGFLGVGSGGLPMLNTIAGLIARKPATR